MMEEINNENHLKTAETTPKQKNGRKVSMSKITIEADIEKEKRKQSDSNIPRFSSLNGEGGCSNPSFVHDCPLEEKRSSVTSYSIRKIKNSIDNTVLPNQDSSWWYSFCMKCRQKEVGPGWEPSFWPKVCPHPFCPTYRHIARVLALFIIGLLIWIIVCCLTHEALPGGQLFNIAVLCLTAHFVGWLCRLAALPGLIGMLVTGIIFQNVGLINIHGSYIVLVSNLRKIALVVLLTRAGLDLDPNALKRLYLRVITLGIVPWTGEAVLMAILSHYMISMPWTWSFLLGCIIAAVAPAVVVPCLFRLRNKGYGVAKGIPTLIIAVAGIDDALSVSLYGLLHGILFSNNNILYNLFMGPASLVAGLAFGVLWGFISKHMPEKEDPFVVPLRVLMLFCGGLVAIYGSENLGDLLNIEDLGLDGAGPLGVISAAFMCMAFWSQQGWDIEDNPVATSFDIFWMICEPILFSLTGTQVHLSELESSTVTTGGFLIVLCFMVRILITILVATGSSLNLKEKVFASLSWMSKASVQAVLAPAALEAARLKGKDEDQAVILVTICVMSMLITVPIGAISISALGTRLLTKTKQVTPATGWRRGTRPSLRDITIIDEEENFEDSEDNEADDDDDEKHDANNITTSTPDMEQNSSEIYPTVFTRIN